MHPLLAGGGYRVLFSVDPTSMMSDGFSDAQMLGDHVYSSSRRPVPNVCGGW